MDEKITISAEFSKTEVAAALMCCGQDLTPEMWETIKNAPHTVDFNTIEDTNDRLQIKFGFIGLLLGAIFD